MTRTTVLILIVAWYILAVSEFGVVDTASYTFLFISLWLVYKYWDRKLPPTHLEP